MANYQVNLFDSETDSDEELREFAEIVYRRPYVIRPRPNHMELWDNHDFVARFRLSKGTVHIVLYCNNLNI